MCIQANTILPDDLRGAICQAAETEQSDVGRAILGDLKENYEFAESKGLPICQDTGMAVVFVDWGQDCHLVGGSLEDAVNDGVSRGYVEGHLRLSVVGDPLRRVNTNNNTPAILHLRMVPGDRVDITVAPKGFGSENMSSLRMFNPSVTQEQVEDHIVECVACAGSNPCPPVVVGVGLGGTSEVAAALAKRALLRPVGEHHPDPYYADMESRVLERVNRLGIGPQGLGGTTTALWVSINTYGTHIAGLPCAVNLGCHVTRHAGITL
jgi:fumarate hydratase subunit alpha